MARFEKSRSQIQGALNDAQKAEPAGPEASRDKMRALLGAQLLGLEGSRREDRGTGLRGISVRRQGWAASVPTDRGSHATRVGMAQAGTRSGSAEGSTLDGGLLHVPTVIAVGAAEAASKPPMTSLLPLPRGSAQDCNSICAARGDSSGLPLSLLSDKSLRPRRVPREARVSLLSRRGTGRSTSRTRSRLGRQASKARRVSGALGPWR